MDDARGRTLRERLKRHAFRLRSKGEHRLRWDAWGDEKPHIVVASLAQGLRRAVTKASRGREGNAVEARAMRHELPVWQMCGDEKLQLKARGSHIESGDEPHPMAGNRRLRDQLRRACVDAFVPKGVSQDYWSYAKWRFVQRIFSSILNVYSTECMLRAVGVGAQRSLPAAAAFNWLLKDGIGKLGKLAIVAKLGSKYDQELKKFRLLSTVICDASCGLEILTPLSPSNFLLLASVGNVGKSVGHSIALATQPAFHRKFAEAGTMADITAKSQAQHVVADTLGLGLALGMAAAAKGVSIGFRNALPIVSFPILAAIDLCCVSVELRSIQLRTLNRDRAQIVAARWVSDASVPSTSHVSRLDNMFFRDYAPEGAWPLRILPLDQVAGDVGHLYELLSHFEGLNYVLAPAPATGKLAVAFSGDATKEDMLRAVLHAAYFRKLHGEWKRAAPGGRRGAGRGPGGMAEDGDLGSLVHQSGDLAGAHVRAFVRALEGSAWQTSPLLLMHPGYGAFSLEADWRRAFPK